MLKTPYWRDLLPFLLGLGEIETQSLPPIQIDSAGRLCAILSRVCKPRLLPSFRPKQQGFCFHPTSRDMPPWSMDRARIPRPEAAKKRGRSTRTISGSRVILFGRIRALALYGAVVLR